MNHSLLVLLSLKRSCGVEACLILVNLFTCLRFTLSVASRMELKSECCSVCGVVLFDASCWCI